MDMWGLPAVLRTVPGRLSRRLPRRTVSPERIGPSSGASLWRLVERLPPDLKERALTHASWVTDRTRSYERLEFLGDSVLGLAIASALCQRYPDAEEGELARLKAFVVSRASCAQVAQRLDVAALLIEQAPGPEPRRGEIAANPTILGNVLEALIGAVFLTHGFEQARAAVVDAFEEQMRYAVTFHVDHKTALQELLAPRGVHPEYRLVTETGPAHARVFTSEVWIEGVPRGRGTGTTIKMSEQAAACEALAFVGAGGAGDGPDDGCGARTDEAVG